MSQRALARLAGTQVRSAQLAVADLSALGLVTRIEGGRDVLVQLNRSHRLAEPLVRLFATEADLFLEVREALARLVRSARRRRQVVNLSLFGSAARGHDVAGSDLDVLLVVARPADRAPALDLVLAGAEPLGEAFGVRIVPMCWTVTAARRAARARRAPWPGILRDAITIVGPALRDLLRL